VLATRRTALSIAGVALAELLGIVSISCAAGAGHANYVDPAVVVLERVLPPPPAPGSAAERAELDEMLKVQAERTAAQADRARDDAQKSIFRLADALGSPPEFSEGRLPRFTALFKEIDEAETLLVRRAKDTFDRKRPYDIEPRLKPVISLLSSQAYPSGHATWVFAAGLVLADMVPEKRKKILERTEEFANNRVVAGVHYRSDVDAGRVAGSVLAAFLFASPEFRADEKLAAAELRGALKLPPLH
jgi:acid phosphatase (class A)